MPGCQLVIVLCGFGRWLGAADRLDLGVGEVFDGKRSTIPALEPVILVHRKDHQPVSAVAGDRQWLPQRFILAPPEVPLELP